MFLPPLLRGTLVRRYQRFMVDVRLQNGHIVTAHCANTGSMRACCEPGRTVFLSRHNSPARRLAYTFELIAMPTSLVGVNTGVPNRLVRDAVIAGKIKSLAGYASVRQEVPYGTGSRIDLLLENRQGGRCFIEGVDAGDGDHALKNTLLPDEHSAAFIGKLPPGMLYHGAEQMG